MTQASGNQSRKIGIQHFAWLLTLASATVFAQETYKCNVGGTMVYQDRPCPGAIRRSADMPTKQIPPSTSSTDQISATSSADDTVAKTKRDQEYINERVKARVFEREKDQAAEQLQLCDSSVVSIEQEISRVANGYQRGTPLTAADALALQLDAQRRQTEVAAMQSRVTAKRAECDQLRRAYEKKYSK